LPDADPIALAEHYVGAGRADAASDYALHAARHASEQLAFDRAAELLALALRLRDEGVKDWELMAERATMLANAGRANESADVFATVTEALASIASDNLEVAQYRVRAAEQYLYAGFLTKGLDTLRVVFDELGLPSPDSIPQALRISVLNRFLSMVNLRALRGRALHRVDDSVLLRLDTIWVASKGTVMLDIGLGDAMTSWYMREASASGDRSRIARALCLEASVCANIGGRMMWRRALSLNRRAEELIRHSDDPYDQAWLQLMYVAFRWMEGNWEACVKQTDKTVSMFRRNCLGVSFDVASALAFGLSALAFQGRLRELSERISGLIEDAERRGDRYFKRVFESSHLVVLSLAADQPEEALQRAERTLEDVPNDRFTSMHYHYFVSAVQAHLYDGRPWEAWSLVVRHWDEIKRAGFLRLTNFGVLLRDIRARAALCAAASASNRPAALSRWESRRLLKVAGGDARKIRLKDVPHAAAHALAIDAGIAAFRGDRRGAVDLLTRASSDFAKCDMRLHSEAANIVLATSAAGNGDGESAARAREWMSSEGVRNPLKMSRLLVASIEPKSI
jgi:hypothetical protein